MVVVWTRPDPDKPTAGKTWEEVSYFLDSEAAPIAHAPGIRVVIQDRLYRVEREKRRGPKLTCAMGEPNVIYPERLLERLVLVPEAEGVTIELAGFAHASEADMPDKETHELMASLGPYLFIRTMSEVGCGAHPFYGVAFRAVEMQNGKVVDVLPPEMFAHDNELLEGAKREFNKVAQAGETGSMRDGKVEISDIETTLAIPTFSRAGLGWSIQLTAAASWAGTYGGWSGYSRSVLLPAPRVPARFAAFAELGQRVAQFLTRRPQHRVVGAGSGKVSLPRDATPSVSRRRRPASP